MEINEEQKKEFIQKYFELVKGLNYCRVNNTTEAQSKLNELNEKMYSVLSEVENNKRILSVLNENRTFKLRYDNIIDILIQGVVFDVKALCQAIHTFQKRLTSNKLSLKDYLRGASRNCK